MTVSPSFPYYPTSPITGEVLQFAGNAGDRGWNYAKARAFYESHGEAGQKLDFDSLGWQATWEAANPYPAD